jgi:aryl-alcohol dehydrogenase-like predicted oxidoreductase
MTRPTEPTVPVLASHAVTPPRSLGGSGIRVSAVGLGCWAIGGPAYRDGTPIGWGPVDDGESVRAIHAAIDAGVTFFDTASIYGAGHSERVLARALRGRSDSVVVATKFGHLFDEESRTATGSDASPRSVRQQCEASLRRLGRDVIDLYQFHLGDYDPVAATDVVAVLEQLVSEGKVRSIGWSTDEPERAEVFARSDHCAAIQFAFNVLHGSSPVLDVCERRGVAGVVRSPLAMGALSGKFTRETTFASDDVRSGRVDYAGADARVIADVERVRDVLASCGRTVAQGALCWLLARSDLLVPIPGFRTVAQATENAGAMAHGPLDADEMAQIEGALRVT